MFKNNFDEAFDNACKAPKFAEFLRSRRVNLFVKWAVFAATFGIAWLILYCSDLEFSDMGIPEFAFLLVFVLFLASASYELFPRFGKYKRFGEAFCSLLIDVLNGCFDEEISASEVEITIMEYEKSSPEDRFGDVDLVGFTADDFGVNIKTSKAEIDVYDIDVSVKNKNPDSEYFNKSSATGMLFAVVHFPNIDVLSPDYYSIKKYLALRSEKVFVSSYEGTFYIQIDNKTLSVSGLTLKNIRIFCQNVCESVSLILGIVERV